MASLPSLHWRCHCSCPSHSLCWCCWPHCADIVSVVALAVLPSLQWHHCPCHVGVFAIIALAFVAVVAMALSTSLHWRLCCCFTGLIAVVAMVPLLSLPRIALALPLLWWCAISVVALASLLLLYRHCCCSCAGIIILIVLSSLPLVQWRHHPCRTGIFAILCWHCCCCWDGAINVAALASLLLLCRCHCCLCNSAVAIVAWCCHPNSAGVSTIIVLVLLQSLWWLRWQCCAGFFPGVVWATFLFLALALSLLFLLPTRTASQLKRRPFSSVRA